LKLCEGFNIEKNPREMIWKTFMFACSCYPSLLIGRHMDQIIVCSFYVVCKATNIAAATFNNIINEYCKQKKDREGEWRDIITKVKIRDGNIGDVIKFYNEIYVENVRLFVFNLTGAQKETLSLKKIIPDFWTDETVEQYATKRKLMDADQWLNSIKTKEVYVFGKSSSKKLEKISAMLENQHIIH